jgi:threonine dehydrogenase-like Zn-dependent dehydrogenase
VRHRQGHLRFAYGTPPPGSDRFVLGHESLGEVVEAGPGVADLRTGDLVVSTVRLPCSDANCAPAAPATTISA